MHHVRVVRLMERGYHGVAVPWFNVPQHGNEWATNELQDSRPRRYSVSCSRPNRELFAYYLVSPSQ